jgi:membrane protein implicated in regulation of membrane protease activity
MSLRKVLACVSLVLAAAAATWWVYGGGLLALALALFALACPLVVLIVMRMQRDTEAQIRDQVEARRRDATPH